MTFTVLLSLTLIAGSVGAIDRFGGKTNAKSTGLLVDYATFMHESEDSVRLEVYYQYYNSLLTFKPVSGKLQADIEIKARIKDRNDRQITFRSDSRTITVPDEARARSRTDFRVNQFNFVLPKGKYTIDFGILDNHAQVRHTRELKIKVRPFKKDRIGISEIELVRAVAPAGDEQLAFDKGDFAVIPSLTAEYGDGDNSSMMFYVELYKGEEDYRDVLLETAIRKRWGGIVYRDSMTITLDEPIKRQIREISISDLGPAEYDVEVRLRGHKLRKLDEKRRAFYVVWSEEAVLRNDVKEVVKLLGLIAQPRELDSLKKAETYEERVAQVEKFWARRDPTPGSPENEIKREFFRRVKIANRNFGFMSTPGWRTDRGQVFVKHGEPDQIDDYPIVPGQVPYQEWHYYRGNRYRKFTFVDRNGDGDYRLVYPYDGLNQLPDF